MCIRKKACRTDNQDYDTSNEGYFGEEPRAPQDVRYCTEFIVQNVNVYFHNLRLL